jgi:hypothetical protein
MPAAGMHLRRAFPFQSREEKVSTMTTTTTPRTNINGQQRKTLASQLDRLDGILDGLDAALASAVQEAVEQAVKQAVQSVLTEVLTNRELQQQLQQSSQPGPLPEEPRGSKKGTPNRLWQATTARMRQTVQTVKKIGSGIGMAFVAAGGMLAGVIYAARKRIAAVAVYDAGRSLIRKSGTAMVRLLPLFAFGGT